jgi:hypothetical protein
MNHSPASVAFPPVPSNQNPYNSDPFAEAWSVQVPLLGDAPTSRPVGLNSVRSNREPGRKNPETVVAGASLSRGALARGILDRGALARNAGRAGEQLQVSHEGAEPGTGKRA